MGYAAIDNGFLNFNHLHIPRANMLMKYSQVRALLKYLLVYWF
jgi:hypothetical protein